MPAAARGKDSGHEPIEWKETGMPKVDPDTHEPMSDDPASPDPEARGGKREGDEGMEGAKPTGGRGPKLD